mgnify:CR=1 FL=1
MKRFTITSVAAAFILTLAGCAQNAPDGSSQSTLDSQSNNNSQTNSTTSAATSKPDTGAQTDISTADIEKKLAEALGDGYLCDTDFDEEWFKNYYGFDMAQIDEYVAKQNAISAVNPDTVIVLKVKDGYADAAVELLNTAFAQQVSYIRQYPFGVQKVMNARLFKSGNYVLFALAGAGYDGEDSEEELKLAQAEYAKVDGAIKDIFGALPENLAAVPEDDGSSGFMDFTDDSFCGEFEYAGSDDMPLLGG